MSSNTARKSTGTRSIQGSRNATQNSQRRTTRNSTVNLQNSGAQARDSSSSDSEVPTQILRRRTRQDEDISVPGPSQPINSRVLSSESNSDSSIEGIIRGARKKRVQREQSSSDTTSDSDVPMHRSALDKSKTNKTKKLTKKTSNGTGRQKKGPRRNSSDSDENRSRIPSSSTQSQFQSRNLSSLVNKCVYFLLVADQKKYAIKKQEILKHVFCNQDNKQYKVVLEEANKVLKRVYGIEITLSEKRKGEYLLINYLDRSLGVQEYEEINSIDLQKRGLIFYLLTVIFMNENSISEDELWKALKPLGIDNTSRTPHPVFGDFRKYLTSELVKQMYLEHRCLSKDPPQYEFSWGIRAKLEVDKKDLLEFACQILSDTKPNDWILQNKDAINAAKQREENIRQRAAS